MHFQECPHSSGHSSAHMLGNIRFLRDKLLKKKMLINIIAYYFGPTKLIRRPYKICLLLSSNTYDIREHCIPLLLLISLDMVHLQRVRLSIFLCCLFVHHPRRTQNILLVSNLPTDNQLNKTKIFHTI